MTLQWPRMIMMMIVVVVVTMTMMTTTTVLMMVMAILTVMMTKMMMTTMMIKAASLPDSKHAAVLQELILPTVQDARRIARNFGMCTEGIYVERVYAAFPKIKKGGGGATLQRSLLLSRRERGKALLRTTVRCPSRALAAAAGSGRPLGRVGDPSRRAAARAIPATGPRAEA